MNATKGSEISSAEIAQKAISAQLAIEERRAIRERIKKIIADQLMIDEDEVKNESSFVDDLGADSIDVLELVMEFEDEFSVDISDEDAEKITTVIDAIAYLVPIIEKKRDS